MLTEAEVKLMTKEQKLERLNRLNEELRSLKLEKLRRLEEEGARYYTPNGAIEKFIKSLVPETEIAILSAANGVGKSTCLVNTIENIIHGPQNDWFRTPFFENYKRPSRGRIISDGTTIEMKIIPELEKWLIKGTYTPKKYGRTYNSFYSFNNLSKFDILTLDQEPKESESVDLDWIMFDEPPKRDIYHANLRGLRFGGTVFMFFTPLKYGHWVFDDYENRVDGKKIILQYADMEDNCFDENTEILAENGWKDLKDVSVGEIVATMNLEDRNLEYQRVNSKTIRNHNGKMVYFDKLGIKTTLDHRMVVLKSDKGDNRRIQNMPIEIVPAHIIKRGYRILPYIENMVFGNRTESPFPDKISGNDWCEFMGWYLSEGCVCGVDGGKKTNYGIYISQKKDKNKIEKIRNLLSRTKWNWRRRKGGDFYCFDKELHAHLFPLGNCCQKYIPRYMFEYPKEYLLRLWESLLMGDGSISAGCERYITVSKRLSDDVQELLLRLGYRTSIRTWNKNCNPKGKYKTRKQYCVHKFKGHYIYVTSKPKLIDYYGIISCVSVDNGTIIVRNKYEKYPLVCGNCREHGVRGIIPHSTIERFMVEFDPDEREARLHGKPQALYGRVHKLFMPDTHVITHLPANQYNWYFILDPHDRRPPAMVWVAVDPTGTCIVVDEWPNEPFERMKECNLTFDEIARIIHQKEEDLEIKEISRVLDPHWYNHSYPNTRLSVNQEYAKRKIRFRRLKMFDGFEDVARKQLNVYLNPNPNPKFYVLKNCRNMIHGLLNWQWSDYTGKLADNRDVRETPSDKNKCFPNLAQYLVMARPTFMTPSMRQMQNSPVEMDEDIRNNFYKAGY